MLKFFCTFIVLYGCISVSSNGDENELKESEILFDQAAEVECDSLLRELVFSSSYMNVFGKYNINLDQIRGDTLILQVYAFGDLAEKPIGWLSLDLSAGKLFDMTYDEEDPIQLRIDENVFSRLIEMNCSWIEHYEEAR